MAKWLTEDNKTIILQFNPLQHSFTMFSETLCLEWVVVFVFFSV